MGKIRMRTYLFVTAWLAMGLSSWVTVAYLSH
jgi:hypothetical protein